MDLLEATRVAIVLAGYRNRSQVVVNQNQDYFVLDLEGWQDRCCKGKVIIVVTPWGDLLTPGNI